MDHALAGHAGLARKGFGLDHEVEVALAGTVVSGMAMVAVAVVHFNSSFDGEKRLRACFEWCLIRRPCRSLACQSLNGNSSGLL
jgi:hypothetical protein